MRNDYALKSWAWRRPLRPAGWAAKPASKKYPMNGPQHMGEVMRDSDSFILIYCSQREDSDWESNNRRELHKALYEGIVEHCKDVV